MDSFSAPTGVRVGTVDKFHGQQAPVVIYSMATSSPEDAPRGMEFLYSRLLLHEPFGAWKDEGRVYLDVSTVVKSKAEAIRLGREHDQIGVYDISKGETAIVDKNAKSGGAADG